MTVMWEISSVLKGSGFDVLSELLEFDDEVDAEKEEEDSPG